MDKTQRIVLSFLNSAEGYFHTQTVLEESVKQPRDLYGPKSDRPERWDYTDVRDITNTDILNLINCAEGLIDKKLYSIIPSTALHAALQTAIHICDNSRFQSKIDSNMYNFMFGILFKKLKGE